jgi:hypothetical protein
MLFCCFKKPGDHQPFYIPGRNEQAKDPDNPSWLK